MMKYKSRMKFIFIPLAIAAFFGVSFLVMELWNNILPMILHVGAVTYWQAMGIFVLCKLLFGFGRGGRGGAPWMRQRVMEERFKNMTPEEREEFKAKWKQRCGVKGWGRGNRHPFEAEWDNNAAEEAAKPTE
jgi:hypothetical protein